MSNPNILPSKQAVVAAVIDPDLNTAAAHSSGWVDMSKFAAIQAIILVGDLGSSATLNAKLEQATDGSGTGVKDITGKAITELTQAGTDQSNLQAIINCRAAELDINNGFTHARLTMTVGTASSDSGAVVLGHYARYQPAAAPASVAEVIE
jgi:hypothetical protein